MKAQKNTKIMVTCALLVALQVILARFLSINTTFVVVNFSFLAVALSGILFGPLWALAVGAVSDLIGATRRQRKSRCPASPSSPASLSPPDWWD